VITLVPRVLEKIHAEALARGRRGRPGQRAVFERMLAALDARRAARAAENAPPLADALWARAARPTIGRRVRAALGGQLKLVGSGGAPLAPEVGAFFEDIGIPVLEGWGLTETTAPACLNTLDTRRLGTVGRPLPGTEVRVAPDGELRVRGPGVFAGYERDDPATRAAFDDEGWLRTGDLGSIDDRGFVRIVGRAKELIVTAGGENVAPAPLEAALARHPWVAEAWVVGDGRPHVAALVALAPEAKEALADRVALSADAPDAAWLEAAPVREELSRHLQQVNAACARFEQVKRLGAFEEPPSLDAGTLTPTLKIVRSALAQRNAEAVERLYASA
jgi:long-chain acyl-CoA synthetase